MNPGGGSGWDEPPLDIQIPDDARELDRDVLAYRRELRAQRRRNRLRNLTAPFGGTGTVLPLLASILAVCLVAGAMLSVATFSPSTAPATRTHPPTATASSHQPAARRPGPQASGAASPPGPGATDRSPLPADSAEGSHSPARVAASSQTRHTVPPASP